MHPSLDHLLDNSFLQENPKYNEISTDSSDSKKNEQQQQQQTSGVVAS
jgi:hypothetical protein